MQATTFLRLKHATLLAALLLAGCAPGSQAVLDTARAAWSNRGESRLGPLNPVMRYLRAVVDGRTVALALGYVESSPTGPVEVWYSATKEALRLQDGRLAGLTGLAVEWREVRIPALPSWEELARGPAVFRWERERDLMPGYRYGIRETLVLRRVSPPARSHLLDVDPGRLVWFEEETRPANGVEISLPVSRYAVDLGISPAAVVYAEQCPSPTLCIAWQRWPAKADAVRVGR